MAKENLKEKIVASLILGGTGSALGYKNGSFESSHSGYFMIEEVKSYPDGLAGLSVDPVHWNISSDGVLNMATAKALCSGWKTLPDLYCDLAREYINCQEDAKRRNLGRTTAKGISLLKPDLADGYCIPFNPRGASCGGAVRSAPIGLFFHDPLHIDALVAVAIESGRMTHNHPIGYLGSLATALFVSYSVQGKPLCEWGVGLLDTLELAWQYVERSGCDVEENRKHWDYFEESWQRYLKERGISDGKSVPNFPHIYGPKERDHFYKDISLSGRGGSNGHDAPMIAYDALLGCGDSWEELCMRGMFHGGDSDGTGLIAGSCWGAMRGFKGVPTCHYEKLVYNDQLQKIGERLYKICVDLHLEIEPMENNKEDGSIESHKIKPFVLEPSGHRTNSEPRVHRNDSEPGMHRTDSEPGGRRTDAEPGGPRTDAEPGGRRTDSEPRVHRTDSEPVGHRTDSESAQVDIKDRYKILLLKSPKLLDVFHLTKEYSNSWNELGRELGIGFNFREGLHTKYRSNSERLEAVLYRWISSESCPVTWSSLMNKLKLVELVVVVREVISFLGSKEALETYQQLDDWKLCTKSH